MYYAHPFFLSPEVHYLEIEEDIHWHDKGEVEEGENVPVDVEDGGVVLLEDQCNGITCQKGNEKE